VRVPIPSRQRGASLGELEARLRGEAVLGTEGAWGFAVGAVVAVIDPVGGGSLRALPLDPSVLADSRFLWEGETWVSERRLLLDPRIDVISAAPLAEFAAPFEAAAGRGLGLLLAVAMATTALAATLTRRMTHSLGQLAHAADAVTRGDLSAHIPVRRGDEVGRVAQAFNRMTESLKSTLEALSQREALALVGGIASELAHEVRTPLTAIKLDLQHVEEQLPDGSELREVQHSALEEVARLDRTVAGVLQVARSGRIAFDRLDVREPLSAAAHAVEPAALEAGATLRLHLPSAPLIVLGDRDALQQLFTNLLINAAEAVNSGGRVEATAAANGEVVVVAVSDDGRGIAPEDLCRVRERFFSTRRQGTGLGLAIADRIAAAHHADLLIESAPARGTRVELTFGASGARSDRRARNAST
jgi:signal transduction histidine kinase